MNITDNETIGKTGLTIKDIFDKSSSRLQSIFVLDVVNNNVIPLKISDTPGDLFKQPYFLWDENMNEVIDTLCATQYRAAAKMIYSRSFVKTKLFDMGQHSEMVVERTDGKWNNINLQPLKCEDGECKVALLSFVDITAVKKRSMNMENQMAAVKKDVTGMGRLFCIFAKENFSQVIKFDIITGEASRVSFENGEITEVPLQNWTIFFNKIFEMVHPDDLENVRNVFSVGRIKSLAPKEKISCIFRSKVSSEEYGWYRTTISVLEEEPTTAFAVSSEVSEELRSSFDFMKRLIK